MNAYGDHLDDIDEEELPESIRESFANLRHEMYRVTPLNGEGPICASVRKMSAEDAGDCAVSVVSLYREMISHSDHGQVDLPLDHKNRRAVPAFLIKSG
jgi:hypothetical protein